LGVNAVAAVGGQPQRGVADFRVGGCGPAAGGAQGGALVVHGEGVKSGFGSGDASFLRRDGAHDNAVDGGREHTGGEGFTPVVGEEEFLAQDPECVEGEAESHGLHPRGGRLVGGAHEHQCACLVEAVMRVLNSPAVRAGGGQGVEVAESVRQVMESSGAHAEAQRAAAAVAAAAAQLEVLGRADGRSTSSAGGRTS